MQDPRAQPDFDRRFFPSCDGQPFELLAAKDCWRTVKIEFLAAFYRINLAYARLRAVRCRRAQRGRPATERSLLQELEKAILAKEAIEDRYAARGFMASPLYQDGFAINVKFQHPGSPAVQPAPIVSSASRSIVFPLPPGLRRRRTA